MERVAKACQLSISTVINIQHQAKYGGIFKIPTKQYTSSGAQINVDDFERRVVHGFYEGEGGIIYSMVFP